MKHFDIIILGAGAAGCMCTLTSAQHGKKILLIDKLARAGKKLLATGNGRCNLTNTNMSESKSFFNRDIDNYLSKFNNFDTIKFFNELGLMTITDNDGRVYPFSNSAKSVVDVMNNAIKNHENITLNLEDEIKEISLFNTNFIVTTTKNQFSCQKLVISTGGKGAENVLDMLKMKYSPLCPSLTALKTESTRSLEGVRIDNVKLTAKCDKKVYSEVGEVLFKDNGISGIVSFNASTLFARNKNFNGEIYLDLMPNVTMQELKKILIERKKINLKIKNFFDGMFVSQIGYHILNMTKIENEERFSNTLTDKEINDFVYSIKNITLKVKGHYENNQVYSGGTDLNDLTENLESKKIKNLYFCGEICDVDGICGGYNLQWAWTSGHIVGESL